MIIVSAASNILIFCMLPVRYHIISNLGHTFLSHFSELKIRACLEFEVLFFTY
jgi:hypothetical protein